MDEFAKKTNLERHDLFNEAATRRDVQPIVIEKDFWVCWTLKQIFNCEQIAPHITFKGGTSLSKSYNLIERFSEDIDLTINREAPILSEGKNPMEKAISNKERKRRLDTLTENTTRYVGETLLPLLQETIKTSLGHKEGWNLTLDSIDKQTIIFNYPAPLPTEGYIKPTIKLEFGGRGGIEPQEETVISPYIAQDFPTLFSKSTCSVSTLSATRSYWEKITILHALCHGSKMRDRMSRHFYDTYMMDQRGITKKALADTSVLDQVVQNKSLLFRDAKASYETAQVGTLRLVPEEDILQELKEDYRAMEEMFMSDFPTFEEIIKTLEKLEQNINSV